LTDTNTTLRYLAAGVLGLLLAVAGWLPGGVSAASTGSLYISEVHSAGSGNGTYAADWFEVTNTGDTAVDVTGWRMDDSSNALATAVPLRGVTSIPPGQSVVFFEGTATGTTDAGIIAAFSMAWFGSATPPDGFLIGAYGGSRR
jgi:hypothetical protein